MKFIIIIMLAVVTGLYSSMWINPASEVRFGPCDISVYGGIQVADSKNGKELKNKAAGVYFDTDSRIIFTGAAEDSLVNIGSLSSVTVNKSAGNLWLKQSLSVSGNLDFVSGFIQTGTDSLVLLLPTTTITGESSAGFVKGNLISSRYIGFGTSAATEHFGGIGLMINNTGSDLGTVTVHRKTEWEVRSKYLDHKVYRGSGKFKHLYRFQEQGTSV